MKLGVVLNLLVPATCMLLASNFATGGAPPPVGGAPAEHISTALLGRSLLPNGDFETSTDGLKPVSWGLVDGATWGVEQTNHFLRLRSPSPGATVTVYRSVPLSDEIKALELSYRVRCEGVKRGAKSWFDARIMANFKNAQQQILKPGPPHPAFTGTVKDWKFQSHRFRVPPGAATIELMFTIFQAASGQIDFDDVKLSSLDSTVLDTAEAEARAKEAARIAVLPKPVARIPIPSPDKLPKELRVAGNQLQASDGKYVWLQGVAIPSLEWSAGGEHVLESVTNAIMNWKANCIRLPVRDDFWAGCGPWQNDGGAKYRQLVEDVVNLCGGFGAYLVLDLHVYRAPLEPHAQFWKEASTRFKNHPAVLFDIINEPHDISWSVWRDGGKVTSEKKAANAIAENSQPLQSVESIGMQRLVDLIRGNGSRNIIIAGGLDWGYDLTGVLRGFALSDQTGNGIMYSTHVYPWKSGWQEKFLDIAARHPVFLGELGADANKLSFIPLERQEAPATWVPDMLGVIQKYRLNWTGWSFHPTASPRILLDWSYAPTPFWGEHVKRALAGEQYQFKRLR